MMETAVMKPMHSIYLEKEPSEIYHLQSLDEELFHQLQNARCWGFKGLKQA